MGKKQGMNTDMKIPGQSQDNMPADEYKMDPAPDYMPRHPGVGKLDGKVALITGGDSGIGRAVSVLFAREGAKVAIAYLEEDRDAKETKKLVEAEGSEALLISGDLADKDHAAKVVEKTIERFGKLDILVNNAAQQWLDKGATDLDEETLRRTIDSNVMAYFFVTQAALPHLGEGAAIVNTSSVNAFKGNAGLVAYSTTKGAALAFSRSMSEALVEKGIRVNTVAPGPIWTPFIPGTMPAEMVEDFGSQVPMGRPVSRGRLRQRSCFSPPATAATLPGRRCTPTGAPSLALDPWPRCPVIYEVYPRSFLDTTGSGTGDLRGVIEKITYLAQLGVDAIWVAPFYPSPLADGGYDVADHCGVSDEMGDIETVSHLIEVAHSAGLRVLTDQVFNHTSDRNPWFERSANRQEGYEDWYVWRDAKPDGTPPNNWMSYFGPPAWTWDHRREQYYWHQFLSAQPNLNLRNPDVQDALRDQMQFWRDLGVDGFRMDAISAYLHDETFADNPVATPEVRARVAGPSFSPYARQDHKYDLLPGDGAAFCNKVRAWAGSDAYLLGEINVGNRAAEIANEFTQEGRLDAAYTIEFAQLGFTPDVIADVLERMEKGKQDRGGRLVMWLSTHDQPRHLTAFGDGSTRDAKFLALACGCLPGPWLIYQGEELGLPQPELSREEIFDPFDLMYWPDGPGREGPRVPLPWTEDQATYGFTTGTPWLPMRWGPAKSVKSQSGDENSVLCFYRKLLQLRREYRFTDGCIDAVAVDGDVLSLVMSCDTGRFQVRLNFGAEPVDQDADGQATLLLGTDNDVSWHHLPPRGGGLWRLSVT